MDLAERLNAVSEANQEPLPPEKVPLTDAEAKEAFLSALEEGKTVPEAAELAQRTITWFRNRRKRGSRIYDVDFTLAYDEIMEPGGPNGESLGWRGLANIAKASDRGDVRASEKLAAVYHGDYGWLKTQNSQSAVNIATLVQILPGVSNETLERMIEEAEAQKTLPKGVDPVIDAS